MMKKDTFTDAARSSDSRDGVRRRSFLKGIGMSGVALSTSAASRILFSVDYPFSSNRQGLDFLKLLPLSEEDRAKIAHGNADQLPGGPWS
jgi:hypothetical protein